MTRISEKVNRWSHFIMILFFALAFIFTVYQVFSRFVLQSSFMIQIFPMIDFSIFNFAWAEELIRYLFVWIVFLGIGIVYKNKGHAQVEILHFYLPEKYKIHLQKVIEVGNSILFIFMIYYGSNLLKITSLQVSPAMNLNMSIIYGSLVVSSLICLLHSITHLLNLINVSSTKEKKVELEEAKEVTLNKYPVETGEI